MSPKCIRKGAQPILILRFFWIELQEGFIYSQTNNIHYFYLSLLIPNLNCFKPPPFAKVISSFLILFSIEEASNLIWIFLLSFGDLIMSYGKLLFGRRYDIWLPKKINETFRILFWKENGKKNPLFRVDQKNYFLIF